MRAEDITRLIAVLKKLPGVGPKTAERFSYHLLNNRHLLEELEAGLASVRARVVRCRLCNDFSDTDPCRICADPARDTGLLCVVEHHQDAYAIESAGSYRGLFYILGTSIAPLEGRMPGDLDIAALARRVESGGVKEIILATDLDTEGELTAGYIAQFLRDAGLGEVVISRIAQGLPTGSEIEYADPATLTVAIRNRRQVN